MKKIFKMASIIVISSILACCATIISGTNQNINVRVIDANTNDVLSGVKCTVTDGKGLTYVLNTNPGQIFVHKGNGPLHPTCNKEGYTQKSFGMGDSFNAITVVNVLFWPGFIVDAVTGAMKDYPSHMVVIMEPKF